MFFFTFFLFGTIFAVNELYNMIYTSFGTHLKHWKNSYLSGECEFDWHLWKELWYWLKISQHSLESASCTCRADHFERFGGVCWHALFRWKWRTVQRDRAGCWRTMEGCRDHFEAWLRPRMGKFPHQDCHFGVSMDIRFRRFLSISRCWSFCWGQIWKMTFAKRQARGAWWKRMTWYTPPENSNG